MLGLNRPQPQEDDVSIGRPPDQVQADPDRINSGDIPLFDEDGEPIYPIQEEYNGPSIWKE